MRDDERNQYGFANSPVGEWLRRTFMTSNPTFTDKRMGLPDVGLRMGPAGQGVSAIGTQAVNPQMAQPESGFAYPPAPQQAYQPYESNYPQSYQPYESNYPQAINPGRGGPPTGQRSPMPQAIPTADSSTTKAAGAEGKGMHYWLDKGDGSPLMPYYSKTGEQPNLPGMSSFADPNYKPFFGLFGG